MKTILIIAGFSLLGWGIYESLGRPSRKSKKGCGCGAPSSGGGTSPGTPAGDTALGTPGQIQGTATGDASVGAGTGIPGAGSTDTVSAGSGNPSDMGGVPGVGPLALEGPAAAAANVNAVSVGGGVSNPWGGNVPEVNSNFVYASQVGGPDNMQGYPDMVQRWDASREGTRISPPITTLTMPRGEKFTTEMNWDKSKILVKN